MAVNSNFSDHLISTYLEIRHRTDFPESQMELTVTLKSMISPRGSICDVVALAAFSACLISRASRNSSRLERRRVARIWSIAGFSSKAARFDALGTASPSHFGTEACRLRRAPGERKRRRLLAAPKTAVALARETFGCSRSAATILSESTQFPHHDTPLEGTVKNLIAGRRQAPHTSKQRPVSCSVSACMLLCSLSSSSMLRSTVSVQKLVREPTEALHTGHRGERSASM